MGPVRPLAYHFGVVLALILASLAVQLAAPDGDVARLCAVALQGATLVAAVLASRTHRLLVRLATFAALLLVAAATGAVLGSEELGTESARVASLLLVALAPPAIASGLVREFRADQRITIQTVFAVLCIYLLVGLFFSACYAAIHELSGTDFFSSGAGETADFLYFSFTTLTTTGYGDLVAATDVGRSLAITEALIGQIYLVTVVALIVANIGRPAPRRRRA
jgi:hypothetical protein